MHSREELADLLGEADAVLYPSRWEGFGLSMMEALHAGVPVLATDGWPINEARPTPRHRLALESVRVL